MAAESPTNADSEAELMEKLQNLQETEVAVITMHMLDLHRINLLRRPPPRRTGSYEVGPNCC